ncbi:MAG: serine protease [Bdellovibrionales bacterium]|nr:serine protease [Bdellovibrionales bacterium]
MTHFRFKLLCKNIFWLILFFSLPTCSSKNSDEQSSAFTTTVTGVTSSTTNGSYSTGQVISIEISFSEIIVLVGTPQLTLTTGCSDAIVNYSSGSGTKILTFLYTVRAGDGNFDLDYSSTSALSLNGGTIIDNEGNAASLTLPTIGAAGSLSGSKAIIISTPKTLASGTPAATGLQDRIWTFTPTLLTSGITFTAINKPSWATLNSSTGTLSGNPDAIDTLSNISICATKASTTETIGSFSVVITGDPIKSEAWHLKNTGQTSFAAAGGTSGEDLNLAGTISEGTTGLGIKIAVSDNGTQIAHEDLTDRIISGASKNYTLASPWIGDPTPSFTDPSNAHGTAVAGIIGATGWNGKGSRGVAPESSLAGFLFIGSDQSTDKFVDQANGDFDIFNYSYGYSQCQSKPINASLETQLRFGTTTLRGGKGALYVKAAGNDYLGSLSDCNGSGSSNYLGNSNMDGQNAIYQTVVVGALTATGNRTSYSSPGSNLWVSAPGGQFGTTSPAIISTDAIGCSEGLSRTTNTANTFESGTSSLNSNCNYTSTMNGTSSAAPNTSGAIALILQTQPLLTWRDVKYILAKTAKKVDANAGNTSHPGGGANSLTDHTYQQGWIQNTAGIFFHNWYGFGGVNVDAAVAMAKTYDLTLLGTLNETLNNDGTWKFSSGTIALAIPDNIATGVSSSINVTDNLKIEAVEIELSVTHNFITELGVELTSPSGTKSILLNINSYIKGANFTALHLNTNAFLDEMANGNWTLKVIDGYLADTGTLTHWKIKINGH